MNTTKHASLLFLFATCMVAVGQTNEYRAFHPGQKWADDNGVPINAHGGGVLWHDGKYYWYGEHKIAGRAGNSARVGVHCYSSADLYNWTDEGIALKVVEDDPSSPIARGCILERPKVIFNPKTSKFVMWFHLELRGKGYDAALSGVAVSDQATGPFRFLWAERPDKGAWPVNVLPEHKTRKFNENNATFNGGGASEHPDVINFLGRDYQGGQMARDMNLFVDDDGKAYHIFSSEENSTIHISELSDDYLSHVGRYVRVFAGRYMEGAALCKANGTYYFVASGCTGWTPNAARSASAPSIFGPWTELGNPCVGVGAERTFESQSTYILPVVGRTNACIFMADRWEPENPIDGRYVWLPMRFENGRMVLRWKDNWSLEQFDQDARGARREASSANETTVHPQEIDDPLVNPYCGWGIWAGPRFFDSRPFSLDYNTKGFGDDAPLFSWVLIDWMWSDLEPKEGQYNWQDLDTVVNYWKARNKQLVVRLWVTTDPGWAGAPGNTVCPDWIWEAGVKQKCPAYTDPTWETIYLPKMKRFLSAYRDRYQKPGHSIVLDHVMGFGDWGEWHTMWSHYPWPSREKKREVLIKAIDAYLEVFAPNQKQKEPVRNLVIAQVYDADCGGETPLDEALHRQALDLAAAKGFAVTRNGFIDGLNGWPNDLMDRYWRDHQLVGEGNWSYEQVKREKTHGTMAEHVDAFTRFHSTYAHQYMQAASYRQAMAEDRDQFERGLKPGGIGYRFVLTSASWEASRRPGQTLTLRQKWVNRNASWCVYPYRLKLYLLSQGNELVWSGIDKAFDPRSWLNGTNYTVESALRLPQDLQPGSYDLRVALVDTVGTPQLRLGIKGDDGELRYQLGIVEVRHGRE